MRYVPQCPDAIRFLLIQSLQFDNSPHFVNPILRNHTQPLQVRHHFSSAYYLRTNGKIERVVGTLNAMLKWTVTAAAVSTPPPSDDIQVFGVDLGLDKTVLDAIVAACGGAGAPTSVVEEDDIVHHCTPVHWSPCSIRFSHCIVPPCMPRRVCSPPFLPSVVNCGCLSIGLLLFFPLPMTSLRLNFSSVSGWLLMVSLGCESFRCQLMTSHLLNFPCISLVSKSGSRNPDMKQ